MLTRPDNDGVGPCVTTRAAIINDAHADVAVDIHADGGPPGGRGFSVLEPVADGPNDGVIALLGRLRQPRCATPSWPAPPCRSAPTTGSTACSPANDLAGLNLTTVPKVLIECGNMRNATDAALLVTPAFQQAAAAAMAQAITEFLTAAARPESARRAERRPHQRRVDVAPRARAPRPPGRRASTAKCDSKGMPGHLGQGRDAEAALDPGQGQVAVEGRLAAARARARRAIVAAAHRRGQAVEAGGGELQHPHAGEPARRRAQPALERPGNAAARRRQRVAQGLDCVLGRPRRGSAG